VGETVVGVDGALERGEWERARAVFAAWERRPALIWLDGPRMRSYFARFGKAGFALGGGGKGRNAWVGLGHALAGDGVRVVASHDCDILTYDRELLARLCYPVAHPSFGFGFCKGYYARVTGRLNGRVMRLLVAPLLAALGRVVGPHRFLGFLGAFRYPLAGEVAVDAQVASRLRVPSDWGLELGMLAEIYRGAQPGVACQSELAENYDHKHRALSPRDPRRGLHKMAIDLAAELFRDIAREGVRTDAAFFGELQRAYREEAVAFAARYAADAAINGLAHSPADEAQAVETFADAVRRAASGLLRGEAVPPPFPSWAEVLAAVPTAGDELREAVEKDGR
jgi:glucosyl-3-phosphoglycerate synthase